MRYGYARVSTLKQKIDGYGLEVQEKELLESGADIVYCECFTGTKSDRPEFQKLLSELKPGDVLMATKLDRISRSASQGINLIDGLLARGVSVHILNMGLMDNSPTGKLIRNIMFSFAEFERDMIVERTSEGREIARTKEGYREGRPVMVIDGLSEMQKRVRRGEISVIGACRVLGISKQTWYNKLRA